MSVVTIHQAKSQLSQLIAQAERGEEVVIARGNQPVVRLVALVPAIPRPIFGGWEGRIKMADDFDAELEDFTDYLHPAGAP
jgi:prevent-host-death family protein